jgi:hypothetical protein
VWDGLRLFASELFLRRRSSRPVHGVSALLPVHAVTVTEAFGHAFRATSLDATKRLMVLQAAGELVLIRDHLAGNGLVSMDRPGLDALGAGDDAPDVDALLAAPTPERARGLAERQPQQIPALRRALQSLLAQKGEEHHQHKYAAAVFAEAEQTHPRWAPRILAPALPYLPVPADAPTEVGQRMDKVLRKAGLLP